MMMNINNFVDNATMKEKLETNKQFRFDEESVFNQKLGSKPCWDYKLYIMIDSKKVVGNFAFFYVKLKCFVLEEVL